MSGNALKIAKSITDSSKTIFSYTPRTPRTPGGTIIDLNHSLAISPPKDKPFITLRPLSESQILIRRKEMIDAKLAETFTKSINM